MSKPSTIRDPDLSEHPANDHEQRADDACAGLVSDLLADTIARCELLQRMAWARELGLDPDAVDLLHLPAVPAREALPDASDAVARMSA